MQKEITPKRVPKSRLERAVGFGELALRVGANVAKSTLSELGQGRRPDRRTLLLNSENLETMTDTLARMRGAAMKLGQLLSMDDQNIFSPEISEILSRLRAHGYAMPPKQLRNVLDENWGPGWLKRFSHFDVRPFAAASIGQVHKAVTKDGQNLAIKVQFPNIKDTIASDVKNLRFFIKASGFVPKDFNLEHYLEVCRKQLTYETDYRREAAFLCRFKQLSQRYSTVRVPDFKREFSTEAVLTMSFEAGREIDQLHRYSPKDLQNIALLLVDWTLREIFDFQLLQSDPNFANYRYDDANERLILLDFGASIEISSEVVSIYRDLIGSVLCNDKDKLLEQMATHNLLPKEVPDALKELLDRILDTALEEFHRADLFSFAESKVFDFLTPENMSKLSNLTPTQVIPTDVLLIQRKLIGMVFLLRRLGAALPLKDLIRKQSCQSV